MPVLDDRCWMINAGWRGADSKSAFCVGRVRADTQQPHQSLLNPSIEESGAEHRRGKQGREAVLDLPNGHLRAQERNLLALLCRMRDARLRVAVQQRLAVGHAGRVDGVGNRDPERADDDDPGDGRPEGVRQSAQQLVIDRVLLGGAARRRQRYRREAEVHVQDVVACEVVDDDDTQAAQQRGARRRVAF